jgi:hypothetical protein
VSPQRTHWRRGTDQPAEPVDAVTIARTPSMPFR